MPEGILQLDIVDVYGEGRLIPLSDPGALDLRKRGGEGERVRRDPADLLELLTEGLVR